MARDTRRYFNVTHDVNVPLVNFSWNAITREEEQCEFVKFGKSTLSHAFKRNRSKRVHCLINVAEDNE